MAILSKIKSHSSGVGYFKELPFYNKLIKKTKVKHLKSIDRLAGLPFYEQIVFLIILITECNKNTSSV